MNTWYLHLWLRRFLLERSMADDAFLAGNTRQEMALRFVARQSFGRWRSYRDSVKRS